MVSYYSLNIESILIFQNNVLVLLSKNSKWFNERWINEAHLLRTEKIKIARQEARSLFHKNIKQIFTFDKI